jgi:hypothetical protein
MPQLAERGAYYGSLFVAVAGASRWTGGRSARAAGLVILPGKAPSGEFMPVMIDGVLRRANLHAAHSQADWQVWARDRRGFLDHWICISRNTADSITTTRPKSQRRPVPLWRVQAKTRTMMTNGSTSSIVAPPASCVFLLI